MNKYINKYKAASYMTAPSPGQKWNHIQDPLAMAHLAGLIKWCIAPNSTVFEINYLKINFKLNI